jgi:POT family proton-dependent oligopeptide transporter
MDTELAYTQQAELSCPDKSSTLSKPFWVVWGIELWERFGYYGTQAILALYFVQKLGYSERESFYVFGSFSAFVFGFVWVGGLIGDRYLGAKRTLLLGATILMIAYALLGSSDKNTVFYALSCIVVGNALFKANPSSLISKLYAKGDPALDGAMTLYYMAVNIGATISMALTPIIADHYGWGVAFWLCAFGLLLGIINYVTFAKAMRSVATDAGRKPLSLKRLLLVIAGSIVAVLVIAQIMSNTLLCDIIVYVTVAAGLVYFLKVALSLQGLERKRMLVAFILIIESVLFFVLYNQMPTSLTFFAQHNINNDLWGWHIPAAEYQVLNPLVIVVMSPVLAWLYRRFPGTHVTKFCLGMTLCSCAFLVLYLPQFTAEKGLVSPIWMLITYYLQSVGELLVSALGLAMVAELCPRKMSGFVMGIWFLSVMLAGPIGAWVGVLTAPQGVEHMSAATTLPIYSHVFFEIGLFTLVIAILMWVFRPYFNQLIEGKTS